MRRPMVAGNWKMHGSCASVAALVEGLRAQNVPTSLDVVVIPTFVHLVPVMNALGNGTVQIGAQDCAAVSGFGAFTGEVSAEQLKDVGCAYVLVGHSERRALLGDTDAVVVNKFAAAQAAGLTPILCVGETLAEREQGQATTVVLAQLDAVISRLGIAAFANAVIAYEPVWAIGTGLSATPEDAQAIHAVIRAHVRASAPELADTLRVLYGGSVKAASASELFQMPDIDGGLVGGASLDAQEFGAICRAALEC